MRRGGEARRGGTHECAGLEQAVDDALAGVAGGTDDENELVGGFAGHCRYSGADVVSIVPLSVAHFKGRYPEASGRRCYV